MKINPSVIILPKGIKDISDVFASKSFKSFLKKYSEKPKPELLLNSNRTVVMSGSGKGSSFLEEYLKTLPIIKFDELSTSKKVLGRTIMILNLDEVFGIKKKTPRKK